MFLFRTKNLFIHIYLYFELKILLLANFQFEYTEYDSEETEVPFFSLQILFVDPQYKELKMVPEFDTVVFNDDVGKVHGPVKTQFGYHLIEITSRS